MKHLNSCWIAVTFLALAAQANTPLAADGTQPAINPPPTKPVAAKPAAENPPSAISERELLKKIRKAWRERDERVRSLLLLYVMNVTESPGRLERTRRITQALNQRAAAQLKHPPKVVPKNPKPAVAAPGKYALLFFFAIRGDRYRSEYWRTRTENEARGLLAGLTPGKDCEYAVIEEGDKRYALTPQGRDSAGTRFRQVGITPRRNEVATTLTGELLLLGYRSTMPALSERVPLDSAKLTSVPPNGKEPARVIVSLERRELVLDPSRDYLATKISSYRPDQRNPTCTTECEYEQAPAPLGWIPKKWTTTCFSPSGKFDLHG